MNQNTNRNYKCSLCFFNCRLHGDLMKHYIRNHLHDPQFRIKCSGCGATFRKWRTFRYHLHKKHPEIDDVDEEQSYPMEQTVAGNFDDFEEIPMHINDEDNGVVFESSLEKLQSYAALVMVNIRENCKVPQTAIVQMIDGMTNLMDFFSAIIIEEFQNIQNPETQQLNLEDIKNVYREKYRPSLIFATARSKQDSDKVLQEKFNMVSAETSLIGTGFEWRKRKQGTRSKRRICEVRYDAYVVPFLDNLRNLLNNQQVREYIENPRNEDGVLRTVLDGSVYRENDLCRHHNNVLAIILYYDDLCIANTVGTAAKKHKMSMFYWTLGNIRPEYRSSCDAIQLYAVVKTEYLKKENALEKILQPFITSIQKLERDGLDININGETRNFKGFLLFCAGDTPAASVLGGFKSSVSAYRPCRTCMATNTEWRNSFRGSNFHLRTEEMHEHHLEIITDRTLTKEATAFWKKAYGVNSRSPLINIIDVTKCLPQDAMHVLIEGPVQITCKLFLKYCIEDLKLFTINDLNDRILNFDYGHLKNDKPATIQREHLSESGQLRQTAAQMITLSNTLLFLIGDCILRNEDQNLRDHIDCFVTLLQITNLCLSYEIKNESVDILERMIEIFIASFRDLYSDEYIVPKFHFITHIPYYIRMFGPTRQSWCFRFEGAHAYFKGLVPIVRNFKNMALTLSYRHQARLCSRLATLSGMPSRKFLYEGDYVAPGNTVLLRDLQYARIFNEIIPDHNTQMMRSPKVIINGTIYKKMSIVLITFNEDDFPVFGEIHEIFINDHEIFFVLQILETLKFESTLNSYCVHKENMGEKCVKNATELIFPHPLSRFTVMRNKYVPLLNHCHVEF